MISSARRAAAVLAVVALAACASPSREPARPTADPAADAAFREAVTLLETDPAAGRSSLESYVRRYPRGRRVDEARLLLARLATDAGRTDDAYRLASAIRPSRLPASQRAEAYRLLADVAAARGDDAGELRWLGQLAADARSPAEAEAARRELTQWLSQQNTPELETLGRRLDDAPPAEMVWLVVAERRLALGDVGGAARALDEVEKLSPQGEDEEAYDLLASRVRAWSGVENVGALPEFSEADRMAQPATAGATGTLGVVLPLSGPFARFGEASLRGVMLAAQVFQPGAGEGVRLLVRDSAGDPQQAARAVAELAADPEVVAVIGPLLAAPAQAAADAAEANELPLLALTPRDGVAEGRPQVFRMALTPRAEMESLADHAIGRLELSRFAILYPHDSYGRGLKDLFWDAVEARGGQVVGVGRYEPRDTDFRESIRNLVGYVLLDADEKEVLRERDRILNRAKRVGPEEAALLREEAAALLGPDEEPLPPIVDFDALFIADAHENASLIAPQLAFHDVQGIQLLGPSGWLHPKLLSVGGHHLEGAVFTESFFPDSRFTFVRQFSEAFDQTFGSAPDVLAAQAFDATNLVLIQLVRGLDTRDDVREGLFTVRGHPGVAGVTTIQPDGNALKRPFLLSVNEGEFVSLD